MKSIIKPYREGYIVYDINKRRYYRPSQEESRAIQFEIEKTKEAVRKSKTEIDRCCIQLSDTEYTFVEMKSPLKIFWDITEECNAKCIHCFTNAGEKASDELSTEQVMSVIDLLVHYGIMNVAFSGGEPFIRSDFMKILRYATGKGMLVSLTTNATLLDLDVIKELCQANLKSVTISLDGLSERVSNSIRKGIDIRVVKNNIKHIVEYAAQNNIDNDFRVNVRTTLNALNIREACDILQFCDLIGVSCLKVNNTNMWGRAKMHPYLRIGDKEFVDVLLTLQEEAKKYKCRVELPIEKYINNKQEQNGLGVCTSTIDTINVYANGDVGPCGFCERQLILGNVVKDGLYKVLINALTFDFENEVCENCNIHKHSKQKKVIATTKSFFES